VAIPSTRHGKSGHFTIPSAAVKSRISNKAYRRALTAAMSSNILRLYRGADITPPHV
jgi:hypothetical protein